MKNRNTIIFIVSAGHSGSTLLAKILGQHPNVFSGSELVNYSNNSVSSKVSLCSCKLPYNDCCFWKKIAQKNDTENLQLFSILKEHKGVIFFGLLKTIIFNLKFKSEIIEKNIEQYHNLYNSIFIESGVDIIVDASKNFFNAVILASQKKYNYKFIFLTRDGRAVLNSNLKSYYQVELNGKIITHKFHNERNPKRIVKNWMKQNLLGLLLIIFRYKKAMTIKHENIVENTHFEMIKLFRKLDLTWFDNILTFKTIDHLFGGNSSRINTTSVKKTDLFSWKKNLTSKQLEAFNLGAKLLNKILGYE